MKKIIRRIDLHELGQRCLDIEENMEVLKHYKEQNILNQTECELFNPEMESLVKRNNLGNT